MRSLIIPARETGAVTSRVTRCGLLVGVLAVGAALRLSGLGAESLWVDEVITLRLVEAYGPAALLRAVPAEQPHLPTYYVLLDLWIAVAGTDAAALRLPSALAAVAALPFVHLVGRRLYDARLGLLAAGLVAVSPYHVADALDARMYAFVTLGTLTATYAFTRLDDGPRAVAGYLAATLGTLTLHPFAAFLPVVHAAGLATRRLGSDPDGWRLPTTAWPVGVALLPPLAGVGYAAVALDRNLQITFVDRPGVGDAAATILGVVGSWPWPAAAAVGLLVGALAGAGLWAGRREAATRMVACWLAVPVVGLVGVSYLVTPVLWPRYAVVAAPAVPLLVARGVRAVGRRPTPSARHRRLAAVGLALTLGVALVAATGTLHARDQKEQWDETVAWVEERAAPGALVVVADCITRRAYTHYATRDDLRVVGSVGPETGTGIDRTPTAALRERMAAHEEVWLVFSHVADREERRLEGIADERHDRRVEERFVGIRVVGYELARGSVEPAADPPPTGCDVRMGG
jgi:hypothetical protein